MIGFLKNFFSGEKSPEEQALLATQKSRDVIVIESDEEEDQPCGGCGCGNGGCG